LAFLLFGCASFEGGAGAAGAGGGGGAGEVPTGGAPYTGQGPIVGDDAISEGEWLAQTGLQPGVHEVYDAACDGERISQDYRIRPSVGCAVRRDERGIVTRTRDCTVEDYCANADDCSAQRGGVCIGRASSYCEYPAMDRGAACERDSDCSALTGGSCSGQIAGGEEFCYPTGECRIDPIQSCSYPSAFRQPCESDADCTAGPGGACWRVISYPECAYNECDDASDCGPAARCECIGVRRCIPASCFSDSDCTTGYRCELSFALQCGFIAPPEGYRCHGADDECQDDSGCEGRTCVFDPAVSHWACRDINCFIP
jgi:hypothetical protein